jgi:predicted nucleic acid-binding protein
MLPTELREAGVELREDLHDQFWQTVGNLKATHRISLADCFALALAIRESATLITADHHEFNPIAAAGVCDITFIR